MSDTRILLCSNELVQSIKEHKLVEHRLLYNLYYYFRIRELVAEREEGAIDGYDPYENMVYLDSYTTKKILVKKYTKTELKELIEEKLPNKVRRKNGIGYISIFEEIRAVEEGDDEWTIKYKFTEAFMQMASYEIPFKKPHTSLDLNEMSKLESKYSQRLYEMYKQYYNNTGICSIGNFKMKREYLYDYFNIPTNTRISEILTRGIDKGISEIYDKLGFNITYKPIKRGRKITHIHFFFN